MVEVVRGKETGRLYAKLPGNRYIELPNEEAANIALESTSEALLNAAGNSAAQIATGAGTLLGIEGAEGRFRELQQNQQTRQMANPIAGYSGSFVPDLGVAAVTGGLGGLGRSALTRGALVAGGEGAINAARTPDAPLAGFALGAGATALGGVAAVGTVRGLNVANSAIRAARERGSRRSTIREYTRAAESGQLVRAADSPQTPRSVGAAATAAPTGELSTPILGRGTPTSQTMLERYGMPTSDAQARMLDTTDPAEFRAARFQDKEDFDEWRSRGGLSGAVKDVTSPIDNYGALQAAQQDALNKQVMSAMGDNVNVAATRRNIGDARKAISDNYDEITARAGEVEARTLLDDIQTIMDEAGDDTIIRKLDTFRSRIEARLQSSDFMTADEFTGIQNQVRKDLKTAYGSQPNLFMGDALKELDRAMAQRLYAALDPEDQAQMRTNAFQWGVANSALRSAAATNFRGDVNIRSFVNAYRSGNNRFKIGYDDSEFANFLDAAGAVMMKESRDSGTPAGLAPVLTEIASAVGVPGAGLLR